MAEDVIKLDRKKKNRFMDEVMVGLPESGILNLSLTCGTHSSGCRPRVSTDWIPGNFYAWLPWAWMMKF